MSFDLFHLGCIFCMMFSFKINPDSAALETLGINEHLTCLIHLLFYIDEKLHNGRALSLCNIYISCRNVFFFFFILEYYGEVGIDFPYPYHLGLSCHY